MIHAAIVEDEKLSSDRLVSLLDELPQEMDVVSVLDSVESADDWLRDNSSPDLIFLDIQLSDGTAFDLLDRGNIKCPIIFTTAYDQYALKAFEHTSIDYLLKPIKPELLTKAVRKYDTLFSEHSLVPQDVKELSRIYKSDFKKRFLVKLGDRLQSVDTDQIAFFTYEDGISFLTTSENKKWPVDLSLDALADLLNPIDFYRVSRKAIVKASSIKEIHTYFNSRLLLTLQPSVNFDVLVSRDRVTGFKKWMDL